MFFFWKVEKIEIRKSIKDEQTLWDVTRAKFNGSMHNQTANTFEAR